MKKNNQNTIDVLLAHPKDGPMMHSSMIPLGIASIAAVLEENNYSVKAVDFNHYTGNFADDLRRWNPRIIGIGGTTPTRKESFQIAKIAKEILPEIHIVYGGVHATFTAKDTLHNINEIDFVLKGECDFSFKELCDMILSGGSINPESIPGLCYRNNGEIVENRPIRINDLSVLPLPARHLFKGNYSITLDFLDINAGVILTSRGCPVTCTFCSASRMFPGGVRLMAMEKVQADIEYLIEKNSIQGLKIFDSTFTADRNHVLRFCKMIKTYNLLWECEIRGDTIDYELLKIMKDAGCRYVDIGLETTNERLLKDLNKKINPKQVEDVLTWCGDLDIRTKVFFIFGLPGETFSECLKDLQWQRKHKHQVDYFANSFGVTVYPGTVLELRTKKTSVIPENFSWSEFKPPLKNLLLFHFDDVFILFQKQLSALKIVIIGLLLYLQGTHLNLRMIKKVLRNTVSGLTGFFRAS